MTLHLFGASDDLIELEGDLREEFSPPDHDAHVLAVSTGHLLELRYDRDGIWRARVLREQTAGTVTIVPARGEGAGNDEHGCPGYSDRVDIDPGDADPAGLWVVLARAHVDSTGLTVAGDS